MSERSSVRRKDILMSEPIRILHVLGTLNRGGAESRIMDLYRHMDRSRIQFDFLVHTENKGDFEDEIWGMGGKVYRLPRFRLTNYLVYRKAVKRFFEDHQEFQCVQGHMTSTAAIYLPIAKQAGVPVTVAHARSAGVDRGIKGKITRLMRWNLVKKVDYAFACSRLAGESVFGKKAVEQGKTIYIPNAIDVGAFRYQEQIRQAVRRELGLENQFVIGHVGRFDYAKNHEYLITVFFEFLKLRPESQLILLGDGDGREPIERLAAKLGIRHQIHFLGNQKEISRYYQAMDYFVFPSLFEGLPGTVIEAQAAGLRCLISSTIAEEVQITDLVRSENIAVSAKIWAERIGETGEYPRQDMADAVTKSGFDVSSQARKMADFYENGVIN